MKATIQVASGTLYAALQEGGQMHRLCPESIKILPGMTFYHKQYGNRHTCRSRVKQMNEVRIFIPAEEMSQYKNSQGVDHSKPFFFPESQCSRFKTGDQVTVRLEGNMAIVVDDATINP